MAWKQQHLPDSTFDESTVSSEDHSCLCEHNRICNVLQLRTLEMDDLEDQPPSPPKLTSRSRKPNVDFLVHQRDKAPRS